MQNTQPMPSDVENLAPGATFEAVHDGQIFIFTLTDTTRVAIDAWVTKVKDLTKDWSSDRPFVALTQVQGKYLSLTPYLRSRMEEISHWHPDLWAYTAVVLPPSFFVQLMSVFVPTLRLRNTQTQLFQNYEEALTWLETALRESKGKTPPMDSE